jgi:hypothetical protein
MARGATRGAEAEAHAMAGLAAQYGFVALEGRLRELIAACRAGSIGTGAQEAQVVASEMTIAARTIRSTFGVAVT